jgi:hypothetical protein
MEGDPRRSKMCRFGALQSSHQRVLQMEVHLCQSSLVRVMSVVVVGRVAVCEMEESW